MSTRTPALVRAHIPPLAISYPALHSSGYRVSIPNSFSKMREPGGSAPAASTSGKRGAAALYLVAGWPFFCAAYLAVVLGRGWSARRWYIVAASTAEVRQGVRSGVNERGGANLNEEIGGQFRADSSEMLVAGSGHGTSGNTSPPHPRREGAEEEGMP